MSIVAKLLRFRAAAKEVTTAASVRITKRSQAPYPAVHRAMVPLPAGNYLTCPTKMSFDSLMKCAGMYHSSPREMTPHHQLLKATGASMISRAFSATPNENGETNAKKIYQNIKNCIEHWKNKVAPVICKLKACLEDFVKVGVPAIIGHISSNVRKGYEAQVAETYYILFMMGWLFAILYAIGKLEEFQGNEEEADPDDPDEDVGKKTLKMGSIILMLSKHLLGRLLGLKEILLILIRNIEVAERAEKALVLVASLDSRIEELQLEVDSLKKRLDSGEQNVKELDGAVQAIENEINKHAEGVSNVLKEIKDSIGSLAKQ